MRTGSKKLIEDLRYLNNKDSSLMMDLTLAAEGNYPQIRPLTKEVTGKDVIQIYHAVCQVRYELSKGTVIRISKKVFGEKGFPIINQKIKERIKSYQEL